mgnify:CR=1 FL=1
MVSRSCKRNYRSCQQARKMERMQYLQHQSLSYKYKKYLSIFQCMKNLATLPLPLGQIQGGYQPYVVPDACTIFIDCRLAPPVTDQIVVQHFNKIIKEIEIQIPGIKISYDITGNRPYIEKNPDSILLKNLKRSRRDRDKIKKAVVKAFNRLHRYRSHRRKTAQYRMYVLRSRKPAVCT